MITVKVCPVGISFYSVHLFCRVLTPVLFYDQHRPQAANDEKPPLQLTHSASNTRIAAPRCGHLCQLAMSTYFTV